MQTNQTSASIINLSDACRHEVKPCNHSANPSDVSKQDRESTSAENRGVGVNKLQRDGHCHNTLFPPHSPHTPLSLSPHHHNPLSSPSPSHSLPPGLRPLPPHSPTELVQSLAANPQPRHESNYLKAHSTSEAPLLAVITLTGHGKEKYPLIDEAIALISSNGSSAQFIDNKGHHCWLANNHYRIHALATVMSCQDGKISLFPLVIK